LVSEADGVCVLVAEELVVGDLVVFAVGVVVLLEEGVPVIDLV
jgi:hypothetical protein